MEIARTRAVEGRDGGAVENPTASMTNVAAGILLVCAATPVKLGCGPMHDSNSLMGVAFRYARWLRETEQWEAMELFTFVIHPAIGRLAGMGKTRIADLTPAIVDRTLAVAAQDRIDRVLALGSWSDFLDFLDVEGVPHNPNLLDREAS